MNIKKKIAVWCALFALLVALVPPSSAKANTTETTADDVKYADVDDFMHSMGYMDFAKNDDALYMVFMYGDSLRVLEFFGIINNRPYLCYAPSLKNNIDVYIVASVSATNAQVYSYYSLELASLQNNYSCLGITNYAYYSGFSCKYNGLSVKAGYLYSFADEVYQFKNLIYSDLDIFQQEEASNNFYSGQGTIVFESTKYDSFEFPIWCQYADLNCLASTNESPTTIPYSYNSYWHIVRKTSSGKWLLTTVGSNLGQAKMSLRLTEDNSKLMIYEFSGDDAVVINVRQYEYDIDGWKVRTYDAYDYDDFSSGLLTLPAGTGIDSTRMIAYTSTPIYSSEGLSVSIPVSSEYYEVEMPSIPEQEVTPMPTVAPSGGVTSSGTMITYKPALNGKVSADSLNMRKEASADSEIVAAFIKTWSLTLHGFVNTSDGVVWYFCTAERDGVTYTGYVLSKYVEIVGSSGSSGSDSESTLDEKLAEALKELEALAIFVARVPMIIGIIFSFMPSWCLVLFGFAFGFLVLKAIVSR